MPSSVVLPSRASVKREGIDVLRYRDALRPGLASPLLRLQGDLSGVPRWGPDWIQAAASRPPRGGSAAAVRPKAWRLRLHARRWLASGGRRRTRHPRGCAWAAGGDDPVMASSNALGRV